MNGNYRQLAKLISGVLSNFKSDQDLGVRIQKQITERDSLYTSLLSEYSKITKIRNILKETHKWLFFWLVIIASVVGIYSTFTILNRIVKEQDIQIVIDSIPVIITAVVSLVSTVIVVPTTIAKFLFNTNEDDNITKLIKHTQEHDVIGLNLFKEGFGVKNGSQSNSDLNMAFTTSQTDNDE